MSDIDLAQYRFVRQYIDWKVVDTRLKQFPALRRTFPLKVLKSNDKTPPYFCHYMAWRLGTWKNEARFAHLNKLIDTAEGIPNWKTQASLLRSTDFGEFWSLIWQLQVAEYLFKIGANVHWNQSGPDLTAEIDNQKWYIECYSYHKSFGLMLFIEEILEKIDSTIRLEYNKCMPFSLPKNRKRSQYLNSILSHFQNPEFVDQARIEAKERYPVVLVKESGLTVYMEGEDGDKYTPGIIKNQTGDTQKYLEIALTEAINNKNGANKLKDHHPNILAINYSLSIDYQLARDRADELKLSLPAINLDSNIDIVTASTIGIDESLRCGNFRLVAQNRISGDRPQFISE